MKFYFDESVELAVSTQLAAAGLDVVSAHSLETLSDTDINHLQRATKMGRVLCTYDSDFLALDSEGVEQAGIVYARQQKATIGRWIREIRALYSRSSAEELVNTVIYLSLH